MKSRPQYPSNATRLALVLSIFGVMPLTALALEPQVRKFESPYEVVNSAYGNGLAMSDQHILIGHSSPPNGAFPGNLVYAISRKTGNIAKTLLPPSGMENTGFGFAVAVSGQMAVVGAWQAQVTGLAFVYDLRTGRRLHTLAPAGGSGYFSFGSSVAIDGNLIVVGAPAGHYVPAAKLGFVYVYDAKSGAQLFRLESDDAAARQWFGASVAIAGNVIAIGAYGDSSDRGAVYLYDARTGTQIRKIVAGDRQPGDQFGTSVDLSGGRLLVGAPDGDAPGLADCGTAYLFDVATGNFQREIYPSQLSPDSAFGTSVALDGNLAWVGAPYTDGVFLSEGRGFLFDVKTGDELLGWIPVDREENGLIGYSVAMCGSGLAIYGIYDDETPCVYELSNVSRAVPLATIARKGDFGPGAPDTVFSTLDQAFINGDGSVALGARLSGAGASGGRNVGVWNNMSGTLDLALRTKDQDTMRVFPGTISRLGVPLMLNGSALMVDATLTGTGITSANNRSLYLDDGSGFFARHTTGVPVPVLSGSLISKWTDVTQAMTGNGLHAVAIHLRKGVADITNASDSGVMVADKTTFYDSELEGGSSAGGPLFGQFTGRVAQASLRVSFACMLQADPVGNMGVYKLVPGNNPSELMRRGDEVALTPGLKPVAETFLGETLAEDGDVLWRASLKRGREAVTAANNEGLWSDRLGSPALVVRKGDPLPGSLGTTLAFNGFLKFWAINGNRVLFLAKIRGRGVNSSNDCGLFVSQEDESIMMLMREGDPAPECGGATVGVIQRVEVEPIQGRYAVLCSLAKSSAASNQALYLGRINSGNATTLSASRLPYLSLRKGGLYQGAFGSTTTIRSMSLPATSNDATGAGGKGYSRAINAAGELVLPITFTNGAVQIMRGIP